MPFDIQNISHFIINILDFANSIQHGGKFNILIKVSNKLRFKINICECSLIDIEYVLSTLRFVV